jgi:hypothetical protein
MPLKGILGPWTLLCTSWPPWGEQTSLGPVSSPWCSVSPQAQKEREPSDQPWTETSETMNQSKSFLLLRWLCLLLCHSGRNLINTMANDWINVYTMKLPPIPKQQGLESFWVANTSTHKRGGSSQAHKDRGSCAGTLPVYLICWLFTSNLYNTLDSDK